MVPIFTWGVAVPPRRIGQGEMTEQVSPEFLRGMVMPSPPFLFLPPTKQAGDSGGRNGALAKQCPGHDGGRYECGIFLLDIWNPPNTRRAFSFVGLSALSPQPEPTDGEHPHWTAGEDGQPHRRSTSRLAQS